MWVKSIHFLIKNLFILKIDSFRVHVLRSFWIYLFFINLNLFILKRLSLHVVGEDFFPRWCGGKFEFNIFDLWRFFLSTIKVSYHSTSERLIFRWFVGTSKGGTADLGDLMLLHTQRQGSKHRQLVKGEWVSVTQPHTPSLYYEGFCPAHTVYIWGSR